jgi:transcriptional regulator with XRE-family HTH domain
LFADGLQALRRRAGKKQHQLAAVLRCDRSKVSRMENHHEEITEDEIERLLIAFQKQYGWTRGAILGEQVRKE